MPYPRAELRARRARPERAEAACFDARRAVRDLQRCAAMNAVLEPQPGEMRLWRQTRAAGPVRCASSAELGLIARLAHALGIDPARSRRARSPTGSGSASGCAIFTPCASAAGCGSARGTRSVADADAVVVRLDPGLAFGTGTHAIHGTVPGVARSARALEQATQVVDYGCGSGVLAIAALKLGARRAYAFDIDPQALLATRENARRQRRRRAAAALRARGAAAARLRRAAGQYPERDAAIAERASSRTLVRARRRGCCWAASSPIRSPKWRPRMRSGLICSALCAARRLGRAERHTKFHGTETIA